MASERKSSTKKELRTNPIPGDKGSIKKMEVNETIKLEGKVIKDIFKNAERIAELQETLTSRRGDYFRIKLLSAMGDRLSVSEIEKLVAEAGLGEFHRHINKLLKFNLVEKVEENEEGFIRTKLGEDAINALRELERRIGIEGARRIYEASLGINSIKLFIRVYGNKIKIDFEKREIKISPAEIGRLSLFLPRSIEGISAIDKLSDADLLVYEEDGYVYMPPTKARDFYQYLRKLHEITIDTNEKKDDIP